MTGTPERLIAALADRYAIQREIGRGGMATVYLADDLRHDRMVAVKVLRPEVAAAMGSERFLREIRIAAQLQHPHILTLHDSGDADGSLFYVMPYVDGGSLRNLLHRGSGLDSATALTITEEVADALTYAHRKGVVHRDIKPENVLFSEGHAVVADFGIAKAVTAAGGAALTQTGFPLGTPGYMSPEQASGTTELDQRTDVFSLACVFYEMVVGEVPKGWVSDDAVTQGRFLKVADHHRVKLSTIAGSVERALVRALAVDPDRRFTTPNEFSAALHAPGEHRQKYDESEARAIIRRAAELDASEPTGSGNLSIGGIQEIAAEVDIPTRHVREAARALEQPKRPTRRVLGIPATMDRIETVLGEVPERDFPVLLEIIQGTLGQAGKLEPGLGGVLSWSSDPKPDIGRITRVQVSPRDGRTRIAISEDETQLLAFAVGIGVLPVGAAIAWLDGLGVGLLPMLPGLLGVVGLVAAGWRAHRKKRGAQLTRLLDLLCRRVPEALPPGRSD